jgi:hypothetical protein
VRASVSGANLGILPLLCWNSNQDPLSGSGTVLDGQFDWGGRLPKCNGGFQRFPQQGWKPCVERKGIRELNCETDTSSRVERRA